MLDAALVRDCCAAMAAASPVPVTVKCRLGADEMDTYEEFRDFVATVASAGVTSFVVHARKCWLNGLNPHENRTVPPLRYEWVYRAAAEFPHLSISLNGGVESIDTAVALLSLTRADGEAYLSSVPAMPTKSAALAALKGKPGAAVAEEPPAPVVPAPAVEDMSVFGCGLLPGVMIGRSAYNHPWEFR